MRRSDGEPSACRSIAAWDMTVLPFATQIKNRSATIKRDYALEVEVTLCVRGVVSPVLANLFLHYAFDLWMARAHPELPWFRYADDGLVHCRTEQEAQAVKAYLQIRLAECQLEMHPTKTKIVDCKDGQRTGKYPIWKFDFLGYTFRPRLVKNSRRNSMFWS